MIVYFNDSYIEENEVKISPFDRGFQFADGVYEVIRTYNKKYFRYDEHIERLKKSLSSIRLENFDDYDKLKNIFDKLKIKNNYKDIDVYFYIQITRGKVIPRAHQFPKEKTDPTIIATVSSAKSNKKLNDEGIKVILQDDIRWHRNNIKSISLLPSVLIQQKAVECNAEEAILIRNGCLTEGTHTNFFGVKEGKVYTYPLSNYILSGITRKVILEICGKLNIAVVEEGIKENDYKSYDEYFITGTTTEVRPIIQVNDFVIGNGRPGEITRQIQDVFYKLTKTN